MVKAKQAKKTKNGINLIDVNLPDGVETFSFDMDKKVVCSGCHTSMLFGNGYTSHKYFTPKGFGYCVCAACYELEHKEGL